MDPLQTDDFDPSLLLFGALAVFVLWKLRSVLGERTERDQRAPNRYALDRPMFRPRPQPGGVTAAPSRRNLAADRWKGLAESESKAWAGLDAIASVDPDFSGVDFITGARKAYDIIVGAFARGDLETLGRLLSPEVYDKFAAEIAAREARGETSETAVVSIESATVEDASATPDAATITVRFASKLMTTRRDRDGAAIEGAAGQASSIIDLWTFTRNPQLRDPNWTLIATTTAH
ncbi:MAG TPA: Tim44/TimA family putative adaptor protein [Methylocystis sp.]|nr:Tim44/TimA family putative adaptor protein [Methylocystis sp.]HXZ15778.1 Tim44/TimA family putative adaptor protein [Roseiarcus sp.]